MLSVNMMNRYYNGTVSHIVNSMTFMFIAIHAVLTDENRSLCTGYQRTEGAN